MKRIVKIITITALSFLALTLLVIWAAEIAIVRGSQPYLFDSVEQVADNQIILVLGTSPVLQSGNPNAFFVFRMEAARDLYRAGKVGAIVVSGDNRRHTYNEPRYMTNALVAFGVPTEIIYRDYAGFRTLDSVIRMYEIFGQNSFVIVSQQFHNERAVFIARQYGLNAYGFNAQDVPVRHSVRTFVRERFARVKVFIDMLTNKQPHFLGKPIEIL
jgi:SanA protein